MNKEKKNIDITWLVNIVGIVLVLIFFFWLGRVTR